MNSYYLRALDKDGKEFFYTGKAGAGWVVSHDTDRAEAFRYQTKEAAQRKAATFNRMTEIHGLRFIALFY